MVTPMKCIVIGGGVGGCCTALEMSDCGYSVDIIERKTELMRCSSDVTPGRMGLGFHYSDLKTACYYLHATIRFTKQYGQFRDAVQKPLHHPLRRGRYFILKTSEVPAKMILETYEGIKREYATLVAKDPSNEVFGPPDDLFRVLEESEYADDVQPGIVEYGIETAEEHLDWKRFREHLLQQINERQRMNKIKVYLSTEVNKIQRLGEGIYGIVCCKQSGSEFRLTTSRLVNATWYSIGKLNSSCGLPTRPRVNRIKVIATVQLEPEMEDLPSIFFCMGPHCIFSNKGGGIGMITFAPVTNIDICTSDDTPPEFEQKLHLTTDEKTSYGESIIKGVAQYIPKLAKVKLLKVDTGVVQTYLKGDCFHHGFIVENLDFIHDPANKSGIYTRVYSGVEVIAPGFVVNACIKLLYCIDNAKAVRKIFDSCEY